MKTPGRATAALAIAPGGSAARLISSAAARCSAAPTKGPASRQLPVAAPEVAASTCAASAADAASAVCTTAGGSTRTDCGRTCRASRSGSRSPCGLTPATPSSQPCAQANSSALASSSGAWPGTPISCRQAACGHCACGAMFRPMPMTAMRRESLLTVSIRMPPSLRSLPSASHKSFGHFRPMRGGVCGSSASATATPTASDSPDQSRGASGSASEKVSDAPGCACHTRPKRPRPPVCSSATSRQGCASCPRARCSSSVLVDSQRGSTSTLRPGSSGSICCCNDDTPLAEYGERPSERVSPGFGRPGAGLVRSLLMLSPFRGQPRAAAALGAAAALELFLQFGRIALVDDEAVVVEQLLARLQRAQRLDEDAAVRLVGFAVGPAGVVDPARRIAAHLGIDHTAVIDVEVERVVRVLRVVRMAAQRLGPGDDLALVLDDGFAASDRLHGQHALAMDSAEPHLDAAARVRRGRYLRRRLHWVH